ncbi:heavy metal translocating P-type ATPase [Oceanidesulfovibrio indonesiensis]|uniref:heavy metal translocating P-type ATPase n=1 Tax=Oceanidesulfovibrio indonesiensis TaxID=54767 RepID=UPI001F429A65|nr:heavy metal translocating P-type ATPase [Oceanidesulfovibrio indonesiensis]
MTPEATTECPAPACGAQRPGARATLDFTVVHELPRRLRLRSSRLLDPCLDVTYLEALLSAVDGVTSVRGNIRAQSLVVEYDGDPRCRAEVMSLLASIPVEAYLPDIHGDDASDPVRLAVRGALALATPFLARGIAGPLAWINGAPVIVQGLESLLMRGIKVETLDGSVVAFSLLRKDYVTANMIVSLLHLAHFMEHRLEHNATTLLKSLLRPQADEAWVLRDGLEVKTTLAEIAAGDHVICGAGEQIPVDGVVMDGEASLNTSSISGESVPAHAAPGDAVLSGSVVEEGRLVVEAREVGSSTHLARIGRYLETSLRYKSKAQRRTTELADRLAPATLALGLGLFLLTRDIRRSASVLTVDYSCALKLASPVTVRTNMYAAGKEGVLLKGAQALEAFADVETIVFDKTGTLTTGDLNITDVAPAPDVAPDLDENGLLALAAAAEEHYSHPVARAVVAEANARGLQLPALSQVDFIVAHGVAAFVEGKEVLVGSRHFVAEDEGVDCSAMDVLAAELRGQGKSLLYVASEKRLLGVIALRDSVRDEAAETLDGLKAAGIRRIVVLTGDHRQSAASLLDHLPQIDEVHAELKPEDKADIIRTLRDEYGSLAFVGDGVNDAPALVTADVGVSMPDAADLARESAAVVLLREDLRCLLVARETARRAEATMKTCFGATLGLNSTIILLAVAGAIPPVVSAALHNVGTIGILSFAAASSMRGFQSNKTLGTTGATPTETVDVHTHDLD